MSWNINLYANITHPVQTMCEQTCAICARMCSTNHVIISTSEDVQYKQVNHQILAQEDTNQKYFPIHESLLLITYQVKMSGSLWQAAKINQL